MLLSEHNFSYIEEALVWRDKKGKEISDATDLDGGK